MWACLGRPPRRTCDDITARAHTGHRDLAALVKHVSEDKLVLWGWKPGGQRAPVPVPHDEFVAKFRQWAEAGAPCPAN